MFTNQINRMNVGQKLLEAPVPQLIESMAKSIAQAQFELDATSVRIATKLADQRITLNDSDGKPVEKSLIELGFMPTFYQFQETTIEIKMTITMQVENSFGFGVAGSLGNLNIPAGTFSRPDALLSGGGGGDAEADTEEEDGDSAPLNTPDSGPTNAAVPYGAALSLDIHHRFGFQQEGSSTVSTKLAAVPAPVAFANALVQHSAGALVPNPDDDDEPNGD